MDSVISISPSDFALAYATFVRGIEDDRYSPGPFVDFQSGLAASREGYKGWLYFEARRLLELDSWTEAWIGSGKLLKRAISAIEINYADEGYRNNTVEWDGRHGGEDSKSHKRMIAASSSAKLRAAAERALFEMYIEEADPARCFALLTENFGKRYDLIAYLFFIRDQQVFMPLRPTIFAPVFELLGVPHHMSKQCSWENYCGFLERLREVQRHLQAYDIPGGVRLIDAHSFCWMLAGYKAISTETAVRAEAFDPVASAPGELPSAFEGDDRYDPEQRQREQRRLGGLAQAIVLKEERKRLAAANCADLAKKVKDVSDKYYLGYDIASFHKDGSPKPIEVKAARDLGGQLRFFLSENERRKSLELAGYTFALVLGVGTPEPRILEFSGDQLSPSALHSVSYEVRLEGPRRLRTKSSRPSR